MRLLIVEDDTEVRDFVSKGFRELGATVDTASDGAEGLFLGSSESYDVIIVDRMLPKLDGIRLIQGLRGIGKETPVLILSALGEIDDRVLGLRAGGDDYLVKPFAFAELHARVEVLGRRSNRASVPDRSSILSAQDLKMDLLKRRVSRGTEDLELQAKEFQLLEYLLRNKGTVVTRTMLLENIWDYHFDPQTNVIDVHVSRLRSKIDHPESKESLIRTIRGTGYIIDD
jgi:two-component system OmpR family response regulator|tara:strand:- start:2294 stop:2977 length:684 start_codon:yes stop_codon:yes gene_type:complete